ncbi:hypothetical protein F4808DRAFT_455060 [Astrocystis sublimbata]|nr:hypothetical protein F4808DRAFT_455060 [Astrocystis sublimbata]
MAADSSLTDMVHEISMTLVDLEARVRECVLANVSRDQIFDILMRWFNEQIKQDNASQNQGLLDKFVELLHMQSYTDIEPFSLTQIDEAFIGWLEYDAVQNPAYTRRYLITQQDLHRLFCRRQPPPQYEEAHPPANYRHDGVRTYSPGLSREQEDGTLRVGEGDDEEEEEGCTNRRHHTSQRISICGDQHYQAPSKAEIVGRDDSSPADEGPSTMATFSRHVSQTQSQDTDVDFATNLLRETIVTDSSSDVEMVGATTRADRRSRNYKLYDDLESSTPPKSYICDRCKEPGHWIKLCPTNLDPRYDKAPSRDYRCNFCGKTGHHLATLCLKNPLKGSLIKQRENAKSRARRSARSNRYQDGLDQPQELWETRDRSRYRTHSPERRNQYRSRTPESYPHNRSETNDYDPHNRTEHDRRLQHRQKDNSSVSPYTARARLTREIYKDSSYNGERKASFQSWDDSPRLQNHSTSPPLKYLQLQGSSSIMKPRRKRRDLDKVTKHDEGRLAYDDGDEIRNRSSPASRALSPLQHMNTSSPCKETTVSSAPSSTVSVSDNVDQVENQVDEFLCALAIDIMWKGEAAARPVEANVGKVESRIDSAGVIKLYSEGDDRAVSDDQPESPAVPIAPKPTHRLVQCPPFRPEIVSLFRARNNPIINNTTNRMTASQMMDRSNFELRHED